MVRRESPSPLLPTQAAPHSGVLLPCNIFVTVHLTLIPSSFFFICPQAPDVPQCMLGLACVETSVVRGSLFGTNGSCTEGEECLLRWPPHLVYTTCTQHFRECIILSLG